MLVEVISHETVRQVLKKTSCNLTASSTGAWGSDRRVCGPDRVRDGGVRAAV